MASVVFETRHPGQIVLVTRKDGQTVGIAFNKKSKFVFGELTVNDALGEQWGVTVKEIVKQIESTLMYKNRVPGVWGTWRREERGVKKVATEIADILEGLKLWTDDQLKGILVASKIEFSKDDNHDSLAKLVYDNVPPGKLNKAGIAVAVEEPEIPAHIKPGGVRRGSETRG